MDFIDHEVFLFIVNLKRDMSDAVENDRSAHASWILRQSLEVGIEIFDNEFDNPILRLPDYLLDY
jgi:hypothetical protein